MQAMRNGHVQFKVHMHALYVTVDAYDLPFFSGSAKTEFCGSAYEMLRATRTCLYIGSGNNQPVALFMA